VKISHSVFVGCGFIARKFSLGEVRYVKVSNISLTEEESPIFVNNGTWIVTSLHVLSCSTPGNGGGLGLYWIDGLMMGQSSFINVTAANGGAIYADGIQNSIHIQDTVFQDNTASIGGALNIKKQLILSEVAFLSCSANSGGAVALTGVGYFEGLYFKEVTADTGAFVDCCPNQYLFDCASVLFVDKSSLHPPGTSEEEYNCDVVYY